MQKAYLVLENGRVFEGRRFGADGEASGEAVFTTAMTGYLKTLTDPSHEGQIVVQTFPLIGNYGVIPEEFESPGPRLAAYVVREWCEKPSNFRAEGAMRAKLSDSPRASFEDTAPASAAQCGGGIAPTAPPDARFRVALWDFGAKASIARALFERQCEIIPFATDSSAEAILAARPDGIVLAGGPGDPRARVEAIAQIGITARAGVPMLGICLGHLLLALSQGASAHKLKFGHRGANQPAMDLRTGRVYCTSQNHGYAVTLDGLPADMACTFRNANDGTCEGLAYEGITAVSVQFLPEACEGPLGTGFVFDQFVAMMGR